MQPLERGASGPRVLELRSRLTKAGFPPDEDEPGIFGPATSAALEAFQHRRGLRIDGRCGPDTWAVLVEAGFRLGDRELLRTSPMMRGDDVADLQQRLGALGFDTGRVDGIFGDATARGVSDFQANAGIRTDGIVDASTLHELVRMRARHSRAEIVADVRAREELRSTPATLAGRLVAIAENGGMGEALQTLEAHLQRSGAQVVLLADADDSLQAARANAHAAEVLVSLRLAHQRGCLSSYYAGYHTESEGGRHLAELVQSVVPSALHTMDRGTSGMSVALLRETRMPAVVIELAPDDLAERGQPAILAEAIATALGTWVCAPWDWAPNREDRSRPLPKP
ncbi:MAG: peptidoglycan-binding protein [Acidimicrobiales bacterium]